MNRIILVCISLLICTSCTSVNDNVEYIEAKNYFCSSDTTFTHAVKIVSQKEFDEYFSAAAYMDDDGKPTHIDFNKQFVIAKILPLTDRDTCFKPLALKITGKHELELSYSLYYGEKQIYTMKPISILIVDRKYKDYTINENEK